ncbi:MAG: hypothetical protein JO040_07400 [Gemmatimonadetes bacterium]|nr:hypothetical protein [Gemmatimonadota bacterium]
MKMRSWGRLAAVSSLFLALAASGCDSGPGPESLVAPSAANQTILATGPGYFQLLGDDGFSGLTVAVIGAEGGSLRLGEHELKVPAGAVAQPTVFTMGIIDPSHIKVYLSAVQLTPLGQMVDVGGAGFARPVQLTMSYARMTQAFDESKLLILWDRTDGTLVPMPSTVDTAKKTVTGDIPHFSGYVIGGQRGEEGDSTVTNIP